MLRTFPRNAALLAALFAAATTAVQAQIAPAASPSPPASPAPTAGPVPNITWQTNLSGYHFKTTNPNATGALDTVDGKDIGSRTDYSNILFTVTRNNGLFRFGASIGEYAFPVVGQALNPTFKIGSNTDLFSYVPIAYVQYVPNAAWTFTAGKMATLIGQESVFTFQNVNIQRGLVWNTETTISRGIRATYVQGKFIGNLEYNDGFYSGRLSALEGSAQWSPSPNTSLALAFLLPQSNTIPNQTASIANKREEALMLTQHFGRLLLTPYLQWMDSPANTSIGYTGDERAFAGVMIASYGFSDAWSLGARYESIVNRSSPLDGSANADLVGFGPSSKARTFTLTPSFRTNHTTIRGEYSSANLSSFAPGFGFGPTGTGNTQSRIGFELGVQF